MSTNCWNWDIMIVLWSGGYVMCAWKTALVQTPSGKNLVSTWCHVARNDGCINSTTALEVDQHCRRDRPRKTRRDMINNDRKNWKLTWIDPANRIEWRKKLGTNMGDIQPTLSGTSMLNKWWWWWWWWWWWKDFAKDLNCISHLTI